MKRMQVFVDSGSSVIRLPREIADKINAAFQPPARRYAGFYLVACNATAPDLSIVIGGHALPLNPTDPRLQQQLFERSSGLQ